MEEDFGSQKAFVANVDAERLLCHRIGTIVPLEPLRRLRIVLSKFLCDIRTNVAESFLKTEAPTFAPWMTERTGTYLDGFCSFQRLLRRNSNFAFTKQALNEVSNIAAGNRNVFDTRTDYVAFGLKWQRFSELEMIGICTKMAALTTGIQCVTPSPLSITKPVKLRSFSSLLCHDAAKAKTA